MTLRSSVLIHYNAKQHIYKQVQQQQTDWGRRHRGHAQGVPLPWEAARGPRSNPPTTATTRATATTATTATARAITRNEYATATSTYSKRGRKSIGKRRASWFPIALGATLSDAWMLSVLSLCLSRSSAVKTAGLPRG